MPEFPECDPIVTHARRGWMARTPDNHPNRIAVIERTEEEAIDAFRIAMGCWRELHDRGLEKTQQAVGAG